jgi:hypothetical protein
MLHYNVLLLCTETLRVRSWPRRSSVAKGVQISQPSARVRHLSRRCHASPQMKLGLGDRGREKCTPSPFLHFE